MENKGKMLTIALTIAALSISAGDFTAFADEGDVEISEANFPDAVFREYVKKFDTITPDDKLSQDEIAAVTAINVKNKYIRDLTGIEYFTALKTLNCNDNSTLTSLDVSKNTALTELLCISCRLASLDVSGCTELTKLFCGENYELTSLDVSGNPKLRYLSCYTNKIGSLDLSNNPSLKELNCYNNLLTSLNVNNCNALTELNCSSNSLTELNVSGCTALTTLSCCEAQLTSLDVSGNTSLKVLYCYDNQLTSLDVKGCTGLKELCCDINQLTSLDLSGCTSLTSFDCGDQDFYISKVNISYPLSSLPAGFDSKKADGWTGAEYDAGTNSLKNFTSTAVTYVYDCGKGKAMNVTLFIASYISPDDAEINEENFPDPVFREYVLENFNADHNNIMTKNELAAVSEIDVSDKGISDLKGIEYFTALTYLDCGNNKLESLDVSKCTALTQLWCGDNKLKALNVSGSTGLEILSCGGNQLTELDLGSNTALGSLSCNNNKLTVLDVSNNADLSSLNCDDNQLVSLDVSRNTALLSLSCANNGLTALNASGNTLLKDLNCANNQLASLDVSGNTALTGLTCSDNQITELDAGRCSALRMLECRNNKLTRLDVSGCSSLALLQCSGNRLTSLDLSRCTSLANADLTGNSFDIGEVTSSYDLKNLPAGFDITKASDWQGADCEKGILTNITSDRITYTYDCGNGINADFTLTVALVPEDPVSAFVERLYTTLLDRPSDEKGKAEWVTDLNSGRSAADAASGFVLSAELKNQNLSNSEFVDRMYRTFLDREADAAGKADWVSILDSCCSYAYILNSFAGSQEFINLCDSYGITAGSYESSEPRDKNADLTAFVSRMYTKALGRAYDVSGLNGWTGDYLDGKATADKIAYGFILSDEFVNRNLSDEAYVDTLYRTFFDREPDEGGKAGWLDELNNGASRKDVLDGFLGAEEFANLKAGFGV